MIAQHPTGQLAVATGPFSDLIVLDVEEAGLEETLERWEEWVGGWSLPPTLRARTESGGLHLFYSYTCAVRRTGQPVRQLIRPLPDLDVKASGGYVAVPNGLSTRSWVNWQDSPQDTGDDLARWLVQPRRGSYLGREGHSFNPGHAPSGYDFDWARENGPKHGTRDFFFNDLIFRLRTRGDDKDAVLEECRRVWERLDQTDPFHWEWLEYKVDRVFATVTTAITSALMNWARDALPVARTLITVSVTVSEVPESANAVPKSANVTTQTVVRHGRRTSIEGEDPWTK